MAKKKAIPDGWRGISKVGKPVPGTRFLPFKVPLRRTVSNNLKPEKLFTPTMLMNKEPKISLVIDLTDTYKYYDGLEFSSRGVTYVKIAIPGRQLPARWMIKKFFNVVDNFMMSEDAKDKYIGVHCTHGINRTGYMICLYMIRKLGIAPKDAISTFQKARGHHIVRSYLLQPLLGNNSATTQEHSNVNHPQPNKKLKKNSRHTPGTNSRNHQGSYGPKHMPSNRNTHNIPRFQEPPDMNWESSDTYQDPPDMNWESPDTYQDPPDMNWGSSDTYQGPSNMKRDSLDMHQDLPDMNRVSPDTYRKPPTMIRDTLEMFQNPPVNRESQEVLPLNIPNMPTGKGWLNVDGFKKKIRDKYSSYNQDNRSERNDFLRSMWAKKRDRILPERNDQQ